MSNTYNELYKVPSSHLTNYGFILNRFFLNYGMNGDCGIETILALGKFHSSVDENPLYIIQRRPSNNNRIDRILLGWINKELITSILSKKKLVDRDNYHTFPYLITQKINTETDDTILGKYNVGFFSKIIEVVICKDRYNPSLWLVQRRPLSQYTESSNKSYIYLGQSQEAFMSTIILNEIIKNAILHTGTIH